ncbi:MAG: cell division protein CrgA [Acidimicrobiales bacterium]
MAKPVKRKVEGGRVTSKSAKAEKGGGRVTPSPTGRYTPPVPRELKVSPRWVPVLMFGLLGLGILVILLNYVGIVPALGPLPDDTSNWYLLIGLVLILGGIITATQWH